MPTIKTGEIWQATLATVRPQFWTLFAVAAPFTLLVDMIMALYGPAMPLTMAGFTPRVALLLVIIPGVIGAIAQLAVAHMVARPADLPRVALGAAFAALPAYVGALFLSAIPTGLAFLILVVPGLYITARLFLVIPVAVIERLGPVAIIRRSWTLTGPVGWTMLWLLVLALLSTIGIGVLASGVGSALASVLTIIGLKPVGVFLAALVGAFASTTISIAIAAAAALIYLRLAEPARA